MKKEELFNIIGEVDEQKVAAAGMAMNTKKKSRPVWLKWGAMAACLCLVVALLPLINSMVNTETPNNPNPGALAAHFYLDGKGYFYHGELTYELPEGYEYVGDVINVGDISSGSRKDFEGNVDGRIYMNPSISDTAYFSWADSEWNEEVDGPKPFLKLEIKTTE